VLGLESARVADNEELVSEGCITVTALSDIRNACLPIPIEGERYVDRPLIFPACINEPGIKRERDSWPAEVSALSEEIAHGNAFTPNPNRKVEVPHFWRRE